MIDERRLIEGVDRAARQAGVRLTDRWRTFYRLLGVEIGEALCVNPPAPPIFPVPPATPPEA